MEEPVKNAIGPLLRLPPFAFLSVIFILWNTFIRDAQVNNLEEQPAPRNNAVITLLVLAQAQNNRAPVRFENIVQDSRDFLRWPSGWIGQ